MKYFCRPLLLGLDLSECVVVENAIALTTFSNLTFVYAGTLVVQGQGMVQVQAIGAQTEMGKIGKALQNVKPELTTLAAGNKSVSESICWALR